MYKDNYSIYLSSDDLSLEIFDRADEYPQDCEYIPLVEYLQHFSDGDVLPPLLGFELSTILLREEGRTRGEACYAVELLYDILKRS